MKTHILISSLFSLGVSLVISSCGTELDPDPDPVKQQGSRVPITALQLAPADNCTDLKSYAVDSLLKRLTNRDNYYYAYMCGQGGGFQSPSPTQPDTGFVDAPEAGDMVSVKAPVDVSDTNNQVVGVNEGDIVKTDNNGYSYIVNGQHFIVARGYPPTELAIIHESELQGRGIALYLDKENKKVVVVVTPQVPMYGVLPEPRTDQIIAPAYRMDNHIIVKIYDVSSPGTPAVVKELKLDGYYVTGRRIAERLHLVLGDIVGLGPIEQDQTIIEQQCGYYQAIADVQTNNPGAAPELIDSDPQVVEAKTKLSSAISAYFDAWPDEELLPAAFVVSENQETAIPYLACSDVHHPEVNLNLGLRVVASMNTDGSSVSATAVVNNAGNVYASENNLYLAEVDRNWWWPEPSESGVLSQTAIYKISISDVKPEFTAVGTVDGHARNQFNFSEHKGDLRVATQQVDLMGGGSNRRTELASNVFVLRDNGNGTLETIGEVRGLAMGETLRSARFVGNTGYVVTFRQVDPLFTFDLTDPENPKLMGERTIPGFSTYMHPYGENHLITIGRAGGVGGAGAAQGMKFQLVDVSDLTDPKVLHAYVPNSTKNWSWSEAEYDHKAFTFYEPANLLSVPVYMDKHNTSEGEQYFSGFMALNVSIETGFSLLGLVDHEDLAVDFYCKNNAVEGFPIQDCSNSWMVRWAMPRRSYVMTSDTADVYLYTLSEVGVKAAEISDLSVTLGSVVFPANPYPYPLTYY